MHKIDANVAGLDHDAIHHQVIWCAGFDTNFYEQWFTGPLAQRIWWSYNFFSGPDNN